MKSKNEALTLLSDLIGVAEKVDEDHKKKSIREGKAVRAIGDSWMLFHLRVLESLIKEESNE
jgi:hypothetical protein